MLSSRLTTYLALILVVGAVACSLPQVQDESVDKDGKTVDTLADSRSAGGDADLPGKPPQDNVIQTEAATAADNGDAPGCKLTVQVPDFNACGCGEDLPGGQCGRMIADEQIILAEVTLTCADQIENPGIQRVVLNEVLPDGAGKVLLDVDMAPVQGTNTYELQFNVSETFEGLPYFIGETRTMLLEVQAYSIPLGDEEPIISGKKNLLVWVDINGPSIEMIEPAPGITGGPYINELFWEFVAGDEGAGLVEVDVALDWLMLDKVLVTQSPYTDETYSGLSPFVVLANTTAKFRLVALDCLGNQTTVHTPVKLVAAPPPTDTGTLLCSEGAGKTNSLSVGQGDADGTRLDFLVSTGKSIYVAWGSGSGPLFKPLQKIGADVEGDFMDAHFISVDGDDHPDIAAVRSGVGVKKNGWVAVFRQDTAEGKGLRTFTHVEEWMVGVKPFAMEVCDLDDDGRNDVAVAHPGEADSVAVLFSTEKDADPETPGTFLQEPEYLTGAAGITDMKCADAGGSSLPDIIMARGSSEAVSVFLNVGSGDFGMALNSLLLDEAAVLLDVGHFNQDGLPDIAVFVESLNVALSLDGLGTGYFKAAQFGDTVDDWEAFGQKFVSGIIGKEVGSSPGSGGGEVVVVAPGTNSLVAAHLDDDGIQDIALSDGIGDQIQIFYGTASGKFKEGNFAVVGDEPNSLVAGDFNNSGIDDLAFLYADTCKIGWLLSKSVSTFQLPCSGKGQCMGSGDGGCDCHCVCICSDNLCGWKCDWYPAVDTCGAAPGCGAAQDWECKCEQECKCKCDDFGQLSCPWELEFKFAGNGTCEEYPGCPEDPVPDPACACNDLCFCGCSGTGAASCSPASKYINTSGIEMCEGEGQCYGNGKCEKKPTCSAPIPNNGQCVCACGCECECECKCFCDGSGEPYCIWSCKQECDWDCHVEAPQPYTPWSISRELPMPVRPDFKNGRLRPEALAVGDLDVDGIPDIVVATELVSKEACDLFSGAKKNKVRPVVVYLGKGQTLTEANHKASFSSPEISAKLIELEIGNMDGDSYPDLVMAVDSWANTESPHSVNFDIMKGASKINYDYSFEEDVCYAVAATPGTFASLGGYIFQGRIGALATGFLDYDSFQDIILAADGKDNAPDSPNRVGVLITRADDEWASDAPYATTYFEECLPGNAIVDPDVDGQNCFWQQDDECWHFCQPDDVVEAPLVGVGPRAAVLGDVDNDSITDAIVVFESSGDISLFRGSIQNGEYKLTSLDKPPQQLALGASPKDVALGDINGDGWLDLVSAVNTDMAISWGIDGTNFQVPQIFEQTIDGTVLKGLKVETGDVNNDGRDDIVLLSEVNNALYVFTSDGEKELQGPAKYTTGSSPVDLVVHDMNLDGCADFIVAIEDTHTVSVMISKGCP